MTPEQKKVIEIIEKGIDDTDLKKYPYMSSSVDVLKKSLKELKEKWND